MGALASLAVVSVTVLLPNVSHGGRRPAAPAQAADTTLKDGLPTHWYGTTTYFVDLGDGTTRAAYARVTFTLATITRSSDRTTTLYKYEPSGQVLLTTGGCWFGGPTWVALEPEHGWLAIYVKRPAKGQPPVAQYGFSDFNGKEIKFPQTDCADGKKYIWSTYWVAEGHCMVNLRASPTAARLVGDRRNCGWGHITQKWAWCLTRNQADARDCAASDWDETSEIRARNLVLQLIKKSARACGLTGSPNPATTMEQHGETWLVSVNTEMGWTTWRVRFPSDSATVSSATPINDLAKDVFHGCH